MKIKRKKIENYFREKIEKRYADILITNIDLVKTIGFEDNDNLIKIFFVSKDFIKMNFNTDKLICIKESEVFIGLEIKSVSTDYEEIVYEFNDEEFNDNFPDFDEVNKKYEKSIINKKVMKYIDEKIEEHKKRNKKMMEEYEDLKRRLFSMSQKIEINILSNIEDKRKEIEKQITKEFENISNHKKVIDMSLIEDVLEVSVKDLIMYEPMSDRSYLIGGAVICIPLNDEYNEGYGIRFKQNQYTQPRKGYWCEEQIHPHIDERGHACFGNTDEQLAVFLAEKNFYAAFITALNFLQTCNVEDIAGYAASFWDEVNENGEVIKYGHEPDKEEYGFSSYDYENYINNTMAICNICGEEAIREDMYICDECGELVCEDCVTYVEGEDRYICNDCIEKYFERCTECDELIRKEDCIYDEDGSPYCQGCFDNLER